MDYLVFRLYGALASWGEIAIGESRHSAAYPGKSALLGLIGAALGIARDDQQRQDGLNSGYQFALKRLNAGRLLRDYHTTQAPDSAGKFRYRTRRDEVVTGRERLGTALSTREYRVDGVNLVAVKALAAAPFCVNDIKSALLRPKYHLYLGRKSCPLSAPLAPQVINSNGGFMSVLDLYESPAIMPCHGNDNSRDRYWLSMDYLPQYYWEGEIDDFAAAEEGFDRTRVQTLTRHDQPLSRTRWQFQPRLEYFYQAEQQRDPQSGGDM